MKFPPDDPTEIRLVEIRAYLDSLTLFERGEARDYLARLEGEPQPLSDVGNQLLDSILELDWKEQLSIADRVQLIHSRPPGVLSADDPRFEEELNRRIAEHESGAEPGISGEEFFAKLRANRPD